jgi:hypothetical protein
MKCPNGVRYENECYAISSELTDAVKERGWTIVKKLAEGSRSEIFVVEKNGFEAVMILQTKQFNWILRKMINFAMFYDHNYDKIKVAQKLPHIFGNIYDVFIVDKPYCENCSLGYRKNLVYIMDKMDMTLNEYLKQLPENKHGKFLNYVRETVYNYYTELATHRLLPFDNHFGNMAIKVVDGVPKLYLIDIVGFQYIKPHIAYSKSITDNIVAQKYYCAFKCYPKYHTKYTWPVISIIFMIMIIIFVIYLMEQNYAIIS